MNDTPKQTLHLVFKDETGHSHRLAPKYFRDNLTKAEVDEVMNEISQLNKLFSIKGVFPYYQASHGEYITKNVKVISD